MMKYFFIALFFACNVKSKVNDIPIQKIIVKTGHHQKTDLEKETYTVYFMNGTSYDCKFILSEKEKMDILKMAQECGLAKLTGNVQVKDNCRIFPKVMTLLSFYAGNNNVQVSIDIGCDKHPLLKDQGADGIRKFLKFLNEKLLAKPEVAKAPRTDISYH